MTRLQCAQAFVRGERASCHNAKTDGNTYTLHQSEIVRRSNGRFLFDWCGHYTATTAAHMNDVLKSLGVAFRVGYAKARDNNLSQFQV